MERDAVSGMRYAERCFFYPGRDCPGWSVGQLCGRIRRLIPTEPEE